MLSDEIVAAIDVGTTKVCTIVGRKVGEDHVQILGYGAAKNTGMRKGVVSDLEAAERAVRVSIKSAEDTTGHKVDSAFVGISGAHVRFENRYEKLQVSNHKGVVTSDDVARAPIKLRESIDLPGRTVIHASSISYTLDGETGIRHPVGMHSKEMQVETHFVTGSNTFIDSLVDIIELSGVKVNSLVLEPLASGLAVLTKRERQKGAVIVDIGGGTTDIVAFKQGSIYYTGVIPVGGFQFTNDLALSFSTSFEAAEAIKLEHANAEYQPASANEHIMVPVVGRDKDLKVSRLEICQLVRERAMELARMIKMKLDSERKKGAEDTVLVLTGGASNLPGFAEIIRSTVGVRVRQGVPAVEGTAPAELKDKAYATSVGILLWGLNEYLPDEVGFGSRNGYEDKRRGRNRHVLTYSNTDSTSLFGGLKRRLAGIMS